MKKQKMSPNFLKESKHLLSKTLKKITRTEPEVDKELMTMKIHYKVQQIVPKLWKKVLVAAI